MRFLADMGLARSTLMYLREQGYDAIHLRDLGLQRLEDALIIEKARTEGRIILTHDLDFGRIIALSGTVVPSVVTFRLKDMRPTAVNSFLDHVLAHCTGPLEEGALVSVTQSGTRIRRLPVRRQPTE